MIMFLGAVAALVLFATIDTAHAQDQQQSGAAGQTSTMTTGPIGTPAESVAAATGEFVVPGEVGPLVEQRFEEMAGGQEELSKDQLAEAMPDLNEEDISALLQEIDEDASGEVSREEWRQWSESAFAEAAGAEGVTAEQWEEFERTGRFGR